MRSEIHKIMAASKSLFMNLLSLLILLFRNVETDILGDSKMSIGVIGRDNGNNTFEEKIKSFIRYGLNITVYWLATDVQEIYQIFRTVKALDERNNIEVIILLDYDPVFPNLNQILQTRNKALIKWGEKTKQTSTSEATLEEDSQQISNQDLCGDDIDLSLMSDDPYCLTDLNTTGEATQSNVSLTITAPAAVLKLVKTLGWRSVFIIHDNSTEWEAMEMVNLMSKNSIMFVIYNVDLVEDIHVFLGNVYNITVRKSTEIDIVVLCRFNTARRLFRAANTFDSLSNFKTSLRRISRWLVAVYGHTYGVSRALQACADDLDNIVIIAFPEFRGTASEEEFQKIIEDILYDIYKEQLGKSSVNITFADGVLRKLQEKSSTWSPTHKCKGFKIDTLLWALSGRSFSTVGYVTNAGNVVLKSDLFPNTKYGYNKRKFTISTLSYPPFVSKKVVNGTTIYMGFCMDLLNELARTLNFTFGLIEPKDQKWGSLEADNVTFNGLVGQIQRLECDMVVAPVSIQPNRGGVADFSYPFYYDYTTVLVKKPDPSKTKWRTLVDPFKWEVLLCIALALPLMTVLAYLIEKYNPYYQVLEHAEARQETGGLHTFHDAFWYMYGALLCQGGVHLPESWAGRTFVSFWWLFCIIVVATYCGNLIAFLTVTKDKPPFNSLDELIQMKSDFKWGTLGGTNWEDAFLRDAKRREFKEIGKGLVEFNRTDPNTMNGDPYYHLERVKQGGYAWIGDKTFIELAMAEECGLLTIKEEFLPLKYALVFPKHSTHLTTFSNQMISIHESGLLQIWKRRWWPKANFCSGNIVTEAKPISVVDVQSAFYVCTIGVFIGTTAFICEIIVFRWTKNKDVKRKLASIKYTMKGSMRLGSDDVASVRTDAGSSALEGDVSTQIPNSRHSNEDVPKSSEVSFKLDKSKPHHKISHRKSRQNIT